METHHIAQNSQFVGRQFEQQRIGQMLDRHKASILIVYGRRRVGKTELLEQTFSQRNILKFEGIRGQTESEQRMQVMTQLAVYAGNPLLREVQTTSWVDVFRHIAEYVKEGVWTLYFEEVQWLADYQDSFIAELKYAWDNMFRHNPDLIVILCGSAPSFMINHVVHSEALYNRSQYEIHLQEMDPIEAHALLQKYSAKDAFQAYLTIGGIPEYLLKLNSNSSVMLSLCQQSFEKNAYFAEEYQRIFVSSLANNPNFQKTIEFLSKRRFATRSEILQHLKMTSGKNVTELLLDLELSGFIQKYTPYNTSDNSLLARYCIADPYLQFYFKFIEPIKSDIQKGKYSKSPTTALNNNQYNIWLGYAFERFCRRYDYILANILGFSAVQYTSGAFYNRSTIASDPGYQIDLIFDRKDNVLTVCEIKYLSMPAKKKVIDEFENKLDNLPLKPGQTLQKVLISACGAEQSLIDQYYFDRIITLEDILQPHYWQ
ncbi:MAG: hypothetical protein CMF50_00510 [Legionellales bacterium]|nr:hypothetical protein [Legionellales bacterium]|tara:strand:+ start:7925 stop:9382 length:1458 start_codon:yes stop_codon:yes gene_type:complete